MWQRLTEVGPLYPGVGWEIPLAVVVCLLWFGWTTWQLRHENAEYDEWVRRLRGSPPGGDDDSDDSESASPLDRAEASYTTSATR